LTSDPAALAADLLAAAETAEDPRPLTYQRATEWWMAVSKWVRAHVVHELENEWTALTGRLNNEEPKEAVGTPDAARRRLLAEAKVLREWANSLTRFQVKPEEPPPKPPPIPRPLEPEPDEGLARHYPNPDSLIAPPRTLAQWLQGVAARLREFHRDAHVLCQFGSRATAVEWTKFWTEFSTFVNRHMSPARQTEAIRLATYPPEMKGKEATPEGARDRFSAASSLISGWLHNGGGGLTRFDLADDAHHRHFP
jgi:hypothetical protein